MIIAGVLVFDQLLAIVELFEDSDRHFFVALSTGVETQVGEVLVADVAAPVNGQEFLGLCRELAVIVIAFEWIGFLVVNAFNMRKNTVAVGKQFITADPTADEADLCLDLCLAIVLNVDFEENPFEGSKVT